MARAYRGPYARPSATLAPYATAAVWGTGIDAVHSYYGEGPPLRTIGRSGAIGSSPVGGESQDPRSREYQNAADSNSDNPPQETTWGYRVDYGPDSFGMGADSAISDSDAAPGTTFFMDDHPAWGDATEQERVRTTSKMPSWGTGGRFFRAIREGAAGYRLWHEPGAYTPITAEQPHSFPTETVSEGWLNKVTSFVANAEPSDPSQYEVQTSMRQRFGTRDNTRAQARATDDPRSRIASRVEAMIEKVYSTGERNYDMFPYQIDQIERPFRFRTAGVGRAEWMETNAYNALTPVQRTPPADPAMGVPEVSEPTDYGYTGEDTMYYA